MISRPAPADEVPFMQLPSWLYEVPTFADWRVGRDNPLIARNGVIMHPFMLAELASSDVFDRLRRVQAVIEHRVAARAAAACRRIDDSCDVDTLDV